jgi:magnesium-protoporphyrin O-methyltransferase
MSGERGNGPRCSCCYDDAFDARKAQSELRRYRRAGAPDHARQLAEALAAGGAGGLTVLDIGAGIGAVHHLLLAAGASSAVDVDASRPYLEAARSEAERRGLADRVAFEHGDITTIVATIGPADLVALDRVVCCHPDGVGIVRAAAERTRRRLGIVMPRETRIVRFGIAVENVWERLRRSAYRAYVHPAAAVDAAARAAGLTPNPPRQLSLVWQLRTYERPGAQAGG